MVLHAHGAQPWLAFGSINTQPVQATPRLELGIKDLQSSALPLGHVAVSLEHGVLLALCPLACSAECFGDRLNAWQGLWYTAFDAKSISLCSSIRCAASEQVKPAWLDILDFVFMI